MPTMGRATSIQHRTSTSLLHIHRRTHKSIKGCERRKAATAGVATNGSTQTLLRYKATRRRGALEGDVLHPQLDGDEHNDDISSGNEYNDSDSGPRPSKEWPHQKWSRDKNTNIYHTIQCYSSCSNHIKQVSPLIYDNSPPLAAANNIVLFEVAQQAWRETLHTLSTANTQHGETKQKTSGRRRSRCEGLDTHPISRSR